MNRGTKVLRGWGVVSLLLTARLAVAGDLRLVDAVEKGDKKAISSLLKQHIDVNTSQADGATALAWAAHRDDLETAELLIGAGANVNAVNEYGVTPLSLACSNGSAAMTEKLVKAGADPNTALPTGETALMTCAWTGNLDTVKLLLVHGANVNAAETERGQTELMWAVEQKHLEVVQALIERGAEVNARSKSGFTPLLFAARQGDLDAARILLAAGADVNRAMPIPSAPSARKMSEGADSPPASAAGKGPTPSTKAPPPRTTADASAYSPGGAPYGMAPLLMASASGHEALAILLLEKGADPNAADANGATALHYAVTKGMALISTVSKDSSLTAHVFRPNMTELAKALIARGANPNARLLKTVKMPGTTPRFRMAGATPFFLATACSDVGLMRILLAGGADPLVPTLGNTTSLMAAAGLGYNEDRTKEEEKAGLEAVKLLVGLGADVNAVDESGWTAMHGAAWVGMDSIVQFLADKGAKLDVSDNWEQTPLIIAEGLIGATLVDFTKKSFGPHKSTAELLLKLGATPLTSPAKQRSDSAPAIPRSDR